MTDEKKGPENDTLAQALAKVVAGANGFHAVKREPLTREKILEALAAFLERVKDGHPASGFIFAVAIPDEESRATDIGITGGFTLFRDALMTADHLHQALPEIVKGAARSDHTLSDAEKIAMVTGQLAKQGRNPCPVHGPDNPCPAPDDDSDESKPLGSLLQWRGKKIPEC